ARPGAAGRATGDRAARAGRGRGAAHAPAGRRACRRRDPHRRHDAGAGGPGPGAHRGGPRRGRADRTAPDHRLRAGGGPDARDRIERDGRRWGFPSTADRAAYGSVDDVAAGVSRWVEAGVDTVVLQPTADEPDLEGFMAFAAEVGRALTP